MKKSIAIMLGICIIVLNTVVFATTSFTAKFESDKGVLKSGEEVQVVLKLEDFKEKEKGINVLLATLEYDKSIFEEITDKDITSIQYWGTPTYNAANGKLLIDSNSFIDVDHNALKIKLKVKAGINEATSTEIKLKDITASDGDTDISVEEAKLIFQVEKSDGSNIGNTNVDSKTAIAVAVIFVIFVVGIAAIVIIRRKK